MEHKNQIAALKYENESLKGSLERFKKINEDSDVLASTDSYVLVAENLTLEERLRVALSKLEAYEKINTLNNRNRKTSKNPCFNYQTDESSYVANNA